MFVVGGRKMFITRVRDHTAAEEERIHVLVDCHFYKIGVIDLFLFRQYLHHGGYLYRWIFKLIEQFFQGFSFYKRRIALYIDNDIDFHFCRGFGNTVAPALMFMFAHDGLAPG